MSSVRAVFLSFPACPVPVSRIAQTPEFSVPPDVVELRGDAQIASPRSSGGDTLVVSQVPASGPSTSFSSRQR